MATLHICLLGDFSLVYGDKVITGVNTARLQALLAYLVLHRHAPQARRHLAFLFWPDTGEAQALTNLRNLFHKLRHALPAAESFLALDSLSVQWRPDAPFTLDAADFAVLAHATTRTELETAIKLYRGDLLPSCYEDWIIPAREQLRQQVITALTRLIALLEAEGAYRTAITYAQQLLHVDRSNEATYCKLMQLHAAEGDRAGLMRVYRACVKTVQHELATEPAPATLALYQRLLRTSAASPETNQPPRLGYTNLPLPVSSFIGRQQEMAAIKALLSLSDVQTIPLAESRLVRKRPAGNNRLVTLTGIGGSGKTQLALHVATDLVTLYPDGVWWVDLSSLVDSSLVPQAVAKSVEMPATLSETGQEKLAQFLQSRHLLLVLDNCEHLVDACAQLAYTLISRCAKLHILATSREPLGLPGEQIYPVPALSLPGAHVPLSPATLLQYEAICLFLDRAQAVNPTFQLHEANKGIVLHLCRHLDGIPLAIELAAVRVRMLSLEQIASRLNDRFTLLTAGSRTAPARHHTLRATLDWSYNLLTQDERLLLHRLAIFAGNFALEAVEQVCGPLQLPLFDGLTHLVDKSLVTVEPIGTAVHYRLLETIRAYAREKLVASGEVEQLRLAHLHFFIQLAETVHAHLHGPAREHWLAVLEQAHDDIRLALGWTIQQKLAAEALHLSAAMGLFWAVCGYWREGRRWFEQAFALRDQALASPTTAAPLRQWSALALWRAGELCWRQCDFVAARAHLEESLALYQTTEDWENVAEILALLGGVTFEQGEYASAQTFYEKSLAHGQQFGLMRQIGMAYFGMGLVAYHQGQYASAQAALTESLSLLRELGQAFNSSYPLNALGNLANLQGDYGTAHMLYADCLALRRKLGYKRGVAATLNDMANVMAKQGDRLAAQAYYNESITLFRELGNQRGMVCGLSGLARIWQVQGNLARAATLLSAATHQLAAMKVRLDEPECADSQQAIARLRTQLDEATFTRAWAAGQDLTLEQALTLAQQST